MSDLLPSSCLISKWAASEREFRICTSYDFRWREVVPALDWPLGVPKRIKSIWGKKWKISFCTLRLHCEVFCCPVEQIKTFSTLFFPGLQLFLFSYDIQLAVSIALQAAFLTRVPLKLHFSHVFAASCGNTWALSFSGAYMCPGSS